MGPGRFDADPVRRSTARHRGPGAIPLRPVHGGPDPTNPPRASTTTRVRVAGALAGAGPMAGRRGARHPGPSPQPATVGRGSAPALPRGENCHCAWTGEAPEGAPDGDAPEGWRYGGYLGRPTKWNGRQDGENPTSATRCRWVSTGSGENLIRRTSRRRACHSPLCVHGRRAVRRTRTDLYGARSQKRSKGSRHRLRILHLGDVTAAGDDQQPAVGERRGGRTGQADVHEPIARTPDHEDRRLHPPGRREERMAAGTEVSSDERAGGPDRRGVHPG